MTIEFKQMMVDPATAAAWLATSPGNRAIRPTRVATLVHAIQDGEWRQTHQAIAFDEAGRLLDGHHRLTAIRDSGVPCLVTVAFSASRDTYDVLDCGAPRNMSDLTAIPRRVSDALTLAGRLVYASYPTAKKIERVYNTGLGACVESLIAHCGSIRKVLSSAPVKLAAGMRMLTLPDRREDVMESYRRLVNLDFAGATGAELAFMKTAMDGRVSSGETYDVLARALRVFDMTAPADVKILKIPHGGQTAAAVWVRETLRARIDSMEGAA